MSRDKFKQRKDAYNKDQAESNPDISDVSAPVETDIDVRGAHKDAITPTDKATPHQQQSPKSEQHAYKENAAKIQEEKNDL